MVVKRAQVLVLLAALLVVMVVVADRLLPGGGKRLSHDHPLLRGHGRSAATYFLQMRKAPSFEDVLQTGKAAQLGTQDIRGNRYVAWGDRDNGEALVIGTPGKDGIWGYPSSQIRADTVGEALLIAASAQVCGLLTNAFDEDESVIDYRSIRDALDIRELNDDVYLFADTYIVLHLMNEARRGPHGREYTLLRALSDEARERGSRGPRWSPLATYVAD